MEGAQKFRSFHLQQNEEYVEDVEFFFYNICLV